MKRKRYFESKVVSILEDHEADASAADFADAVSAFWGAGETANDVAAWR